jgi:hypothetical protein
MVLPIAIGMALFKKNKNNILKKHQEKNRDLDRSHKK